MVKFDHFKKTKQMEESKLSDIDCCKLETEVPNVWELFCLKKSLDSYNKKSYSFVTERFQNFMSSTLQCPDCNFHTYSFDPTYIPSNPIFKGTVVRAKLIKPGALSSAIGYAKAQIVSFDPYVIASLSHAHIAALAL